jgi:hypothetical protein
MDMILYHIRRPTSKDLFEDSKDDSHPVQTGGSVAEGMDGRGRSEVQLLSVCALVSS